ncbi:MAG: CBS domain-containing protein, partial [Bdellovibrionales bacterium]|nr:CBS domain-containing protein [Bdellovibrionales bacterium]
IVGIIDEEDLLVALYNKGEALSEKVAGYMVTDLKTLPPSAPLEQAIELARAGFVPIIQDANAFYGLITKSDIVSYLRNRAIRPETTT